MNKKEQKILKILNKETNIYNGLSIEVLIQKTNYSEDELTELLNDLIEKKLIYSKFLNVNDIDLFELYYSTLNGKSHFRSKKKKLLEKIILNFLCPIAVSLITTLITCFFIN